MTEINLEIIVDGNSFGNIYLIQKKERLILEKVNIEKEKLDQIKIKSMLIEGRDYFMFSYERYKIVLENSLKKSMNTEYIEIKEIKI